MKLLFFYVTHYESIIDWSISLLDFIKSASPFNLIQLIIRTTYIVTAIKTYF